MKKITEKTKAYIDQKADDAIGRIENTPSRSMAIATLVVLSGCVVVLGYFHFQKQINEPLMQQHLAEEKASLSQNYTDSVDLFDLIRERNNQKVAESMTANQDSDNDGIYDVTEISLGTSPYLADSDSDGLSDQLELINGTNPICAEGTVCEDDINQYGQTTERTSNVLNGIEIPEGFDPTDPQQLMDLEMQFFKEGDLSQLGIDDPKLQAVIRNAASADSEIDTSTISEEDATLIKSEFEGLEGDALREYLLLQGFPEDLLEELTNEQIEEIVTEGVANL